MGIAGWALNFVGFNELQNAFEEAQQVKEKPHWIVGSSAEYAIYVEFGTSKMAAQPYMRPAIRKAMKDLAAGNIPGENLDEIVKNVAMKIEGYAKEIVPTDTHKLQWSIVAAPIGDWQRAKEVSLADAGAKAGR